MNETDRDQAYNLIDRFLRNNLDDQDYAEYSSALELCFTDESLRQQLAAAYEAGKREQASELEAARAEIERKMSAGQFVLEQLAAEQAKNVELRRAFIGLMQVVPREVDCGNMHHKRKDQHEYDETCPVVSRYATALYDAQEALAATEDLKGLRLCHAEPVGRLLRYIGKDPYPRGRPDIARTLDELPSGSYPDTWEEVAPLYRAWEPKP